MVRPLLRSAADRDPGGGQFAVIELEWLSDVLVVDLTGRDWTGAILVQFRYELPLDGMVER